jgi:hypothetical protein
MVASLVASTVQSCKFGIPSHPIDQGKPVGRLRIGWHGKRKR